MFFNFVHWDKKGMHEFHDDLDELPQIEAMSKCINKKKNGG
jgi:hypothetical protein